MIEIKPRDLQPNHTYYIDMSNTLPDIPKMAIAIIKRRYGYTSKLKAVFKMIVPENGVNREYAVFYKYTDVNSSEVDYKAGGCNFMNYRNYKYYLPTRDVIIAKWEKNTLNTVLQNIMCDPCFTYV